MAEKQPAIIQEGQATIDDMPLTSLEESLMSLEKLDRASPEIWPEQIPGLSEFMSTQSVQGPPAWSRDLTGEDVNLMHQLGSLSTSGLVIEVKKLHDLAYQLGVEEAKEMTRGKYLSVFFNQATPIATSIIIYHKKFMLLILKDSFTIPMKVQ